MKRLNISKFLKATPAVVVLSTTLLAGPTSSFAKEGSTKQAVPQGQVVSANTLQKGLLSHYFKDKDFKDLSFITTQTTGNLYSISPGVKPLLGSGKFQSAYWEGRIKIDESQIYQFTTSADKFVKLWIDGVQVIDQRKGDSMSKYKQRVYLQKGKVYNIKVEYQNPYYAISDLTLYWTKGNDLSGSKKEVIPENHLFLPELAPNGSNSNSVKRSRVARSIDNPEQQPVKKTDKLEDSDDDRIPDTIETNGYTVVVKGGKPHIFPWIDSIHNNKKELTKYFSSPMKWSTASDPYSDFQKVTGMIDKQVKREARNPLVAAYPIVNVDMEQIVLSKNQTVSLNEGKSNSNTVSRSTSTSTTDSIGASVSAELSASLFNFGISVSTSFSANTSSTVSIDSSTSGTLESNWSKTIGINTGDAAYLAAGIRYNNQGTAPIYNVKPTNTFSLLSNQSIATVTAKENQLANVVKPGDYYPAKSQSPLLLNAKDDFGSSPITLNLDQLHLLEKERKLKIETNQVSGKIGKWKADGEITTDGDWSTYLPQIEETSVRIILNDYMDETPIERRVAAVDPNDPLEQAKPEVTLKEALKLAFPDITEKDGKLYYKEQSLKDYFELVLDVKTSEIIANQLSQMEDKDIYNVKLNAKMNIMLQKNTSKLVPKVESKPNLWDKTIVQVHFSLNDDAPSGITYTVENFDSSYPVTFDLQKGASFVLPLRKGSQYRVIAKPSNGRKYVVYENLDQYTMQ